MEDETEDEEEKDPKEKENYEAYLALHIDQNDGEKSLKILKFDTQNLKNLEMVLGKKEFETGLGGRRASLADLGTDGYLTLILPLTLTSM